MIRFILDLAATDALVIARRRSFDDGSTRIALQCMDTCLARNGRQAIMDREAVGDMIVRVAQGNVDEADLAEWLRTRLA